MTPIQHDIIGEITRALETLGADPKLIGAVASWGDTLNDQEVLDMLQAWNATGEITFDPARATH